MDQTRPQVLVASKNGALFQGAASALQQYDIVHHVGQLSDSLSFNVAEFQQQLRTREMGHLLFAAARLPSTQDLVRAAAGSLPDGTVAVTDQQTHGKGRGGNSWVSPHGCLMFTATRTVSIPGASAPFLNYVVCLAVVRAVQNLARALGKAPPPGRAPLLRIKWPNDIYYQGLKVGGALLHSTWSGAGFRVTAGIGLNVTNREPTTCLADILAAARPAAAGAPPGGADRPACHASAGPRGLAVVEVPTAARGRPADLSLGAASGAWLGGAGDSGAGPAVNREAVLAEVLLQLEHCFDVLEQHGSFEPLKAEYLEAWLHTGQRLTLQDQPGQEGPLEVAVEGLSPAGFLLARDAAGQQYELTPDGNSLDMMQGLLRRKLPV